MGIRSWLEGRRFKSRLSQLAAEARAFYARGMYRESIGSGARARELIAARFGTSNPDYAQATQALAELHTATGDHSTAATLNREALEIFLRTLPPKHDLIGYTLGQLTNSYEALGNFGAAIGPLEQLKQWMILAKGRSDPATVQVMTSAAFVHLYLGRGDAALAGLHEVLDVAREFTGTLSRDYAVTLHNVAYAHLSLGDYAKARELLQSSSEIAEQATRSGMAASDLARIQSTVGQLYDALDDHDGAEKAYTRGLSLLGEVTNETREAAVWLLSNLAGVYRNTHNEQASEASYLRALELLDAPGAPMETARRKWTKAAIQSNLSQLYRWAGRFDEAEILSRQAMELTAEATGKNSAAFANRLHNLGLILSDRGKTDEAEKVLRDAMALTASLEGESGEGYGATVNVLATLLVRTNRPAEAAALMRKEITIDDRRMWAVLTAGSQRQRMAHLDRLRKNTFGYLSFVLGQRDTSPSLIEEGFDVVLRRKAISLEVLATERLTPLSSGNEQLRRDLSALRDIQAQLASAELGPRRIETSTIEEWTHRREQLEAAMAQQIPELALDVRLRNANSKALMDSLPLGSALIEYVRFEPFDFATLPDREGSRWRPARYLAFVLRSGSLQPSLVDLGEAAPIDEQIARWLNRVTGKPGKSRDVPRYPPEKRNGTETESPRDVRDELELFARDLGGPRLDPQPGRDEGRVLREAIFDPVKRAFDGLQRLFIAPDGELSGVPFEALPLENERFLIDDYMVSYVTVGRDILRFGGGHSEAGGAPVVAADPAFDLGEVDDNAKGRPFRRLSGAREEGRDVAKLLGVDPLLDDMVVEGRLKAIRSPAILHLATHGFFFSSSTTGLGTDDDARVELADDDRLAYVKRARSPLLRCGLALAGANSWVRGDRLPEAAEDGLLMAADVFQMDLLGTELVTLSACETGLGEAHVGESIFGLRRAFVAAGAKTLVMSLWKVPDFATRSLMTDMYSQLICGVSRAEALHAAQLTLKEKYPTQPYYWGAFICQGDPRPLEWKFLDVTGLRYA
jgi:CHAT domain-containing protein/tetratricopeptide (TPR) repeat protein